MRKDLKKAYKTLLESCEVDQTTNINNYIEKDKTSICNEIIYGLSDNGDIDKDESLSLYAKMYITLYRHEICALCDAGSDYSIITNQTRALAAIQEAENLLVKHYHELTGTGSVETPEPVHNSDLLPDWTVGESFACGTGETPENVLEVDCNEAEK